EAAVVDITVAYGNEPVPEGFVRVLKTVGAKRADLNSGAGGQYLYLCVRKAKPPAATPGSRDRRESGGGVDAAIVGLAVIFPDRDEHVPPTYSPIRRKGLQVDLNYHTQGERVYLCYKRGPGNPVRDVAVVLPGKEEGPPRGYSLIDVSPTGLAADLNAGTGGTAVFVAYRQ
ncbi:unnamed protein product, partial [Phaeothamnion confervicola]